MFFFFLAGYFTNKKESPETSNVLVYQNAVRRVITFRQATKRGEAVNF